MEHSRNLSAWLLSYGLPATPTPELEDTLQPVVLVDDVQDACKYVDPPRAGAWLTMAGWSGFHSGLRIIPGPRGTWVDWLAETLDTQMAVVTELASAATAFATSFGDYTQHENRLSEAEPLHTSEYGVWATGSRPGGTAPFAILQRTYGLPAIPPFFVHPDRHFCLYANVHNTGIAFNYLLRDVP